MRKRNKILKSNTHHEYVHTTYVWMCGALYQQPNIRMYSSMWVCVYLYSRKIENFSFCCCYCCWLFSKYMRFREYVNDEKHIEFRLNAFFSLLVFKIIKTQKVWREKKTAAAAAIFLLPTVSVHTNSIFEQIYRKLIRS